MVYIFLAWIFVTTDFLIYIMPNIYNMAPYSCFRAEMSVDEVNHEKFTHLH